MKVINTISALAEAYAQWQKANSKRIVIDGQPADPKCPSCFIPIAVVIGARLGRTLLLFSEQGGSYHEETLSH